MSSVNTVQSTGVLPDPFTRAYDDVILEAGYDFTDCWPDGSSALPAALNTDDDGDVASAVEAAAAAYNRMVGVSPPASRHPNG